MSIPDFAPKLDRPAACSGAATLLAALDAIRDPSNDTRIAPIIIANERDLRELVRFALVKLAGEDQR